MNLNFNNTIFFCEFSISRFFFKFSSSQFFFLDNDSEDGDDELEDEEEMEVGGSNTPRTARKRKQFLKKNSQSPPTASPSKRPRKLKSPIPNSSGLLPSSSTSSSFLSLSAPAKICQV